MMIEIITAEEAVKKYHWHDLKGRPVIAAHHITDFGCQMARGVITGILEKHTGFSLLFAYVQQETGQVVEIAMYNEEEFALFDNLLKSAIISESDRAKLP